MILNFDYKSYPLNVALVQKYCFEFYPKNEHIEIQDLINFNKRDITTLCNLIKAGEEKPNEPSINTIIKNLKKKTKKFIISKDYNIGNLYTAGANTDDLNSYKLLIIPFGDYVNEPCAKIKFRYFKRYKSMNKIFDKLIMALRSSKINFEYKINNIKGKNYIEFETNTPLDNEKFWYVVNLWAKK